MRKILSCILVMALLAATMPMTVLPVVAAGIPGDADGNDQLTEDELASNILDYLRGAEDLELEELRDAAHVYAYWNGKPKTIIDTADRTVTIYKPIHTVVTLTSDGARALRMFGDEAKVIGISDTIQKYPFYFPEMSQKEVVGSWKAVDYEKVVELNPDLVIVYATGTYVNAEIAAEELEPFGITVVGLYLYVTDEYDQIFDELEKLAILMEREEEAERYIEWHDDYLEQVQDFVEDKERPDVFATYTSGAIGKTTDIKGYGPGTIDYLLCEKAGGRLITENESVSYPPVSAEWVLTENPDIVVMKCGNVFGWWDTKSEPADLIVQLLDGKSWDTMNATVNKQIYAVPWSISNGLEHLYGVVLLAKIFHPELDINPNEVYKEYLEDFLRVDYPEGEGKVLVYSGSKTLVT
jgi:iron complex transport system substrate-binding protein